MKVLLWLYIAVIAVLWPTFVLVLACAQGRDAIPTVVVVWAIVLVFTEFVFERLGER